MWNIDADWILKILWRGTILLSICAILHWLCWNRFRKYLAPFKVQSGNPRAGDIQRDLFWAAFALFVLSAFHWPLVRWLTSFQSIFISYEIMTWQNFPRFVGTLVLFYFLVDTMNYWSHRLLHTRFLFRYVHSLHHRTITPTTFNGFSAHPVENIITMMFPLIVVQFMPVHYLIAVSFAWFKIVSAIVRHLGYDFFTDSFKGVPLLRSLVLARYHDLHHTEPNTNYTVLFSWWDYWMKTVNEKSRA